jgi:aspartate aminotransferase
MLSISHRGQIMPTSPIRKLVPFAEAAQKKGIHVFHLNIGQPDIETPKQTLDAVRNSDFKILEYSHSAGNESYRKKLIGYYAKSDIHITTDEIIITTGASEAILFGLMACMDPGDEVIIPEPFYANYKAYAVEVGVVVRPITSTIDKNFALPPMAEFEKAITPKTKGIMICNPNNPTGYLYSKEEMEILKQIIIKHNLYLFADEAYREFCYEGSHTSFMTLTGVERIVCIIISLIILYLL